tara:strand:- start:1316 stop:2494 length:1179 start_codon:yes stop_codon:yes gene_type:complete
MSGNEIIGKEELNALKEIFNKSNGVLFSHSFHDRRRGIYRVEKFEKLVARRLKCKYVIACSSGTAAGALTLIAAGVKPGDEVITQAFTFIAPIESIMSIGAIPVIVDVDNSLNMCPKKLANSITKKTKCIMPVHMLGSSADMSEILKIAKKNNIPLIEDACESFGARYKNKNIGTLGLSGFFSLDFGKIITTGEGGFICTNNLKQYLKLKSIRDHGHINEKNVHRGLDKALQRGFNYRMTEMQAAVGIAQLKKLNFILKKKKQNRKYLFNILKKKSLLNFRNLNTKITEDQNDHLVIFLKNAKKALKIKKILDKKKIPTGILPIAIRWHYAGYWKHIWAENKIYRNYSNKKYWKNAWALLQRSISFPISIKQKKQKIIHQANLISEIINKNN